MTLSIDLQDPAVARLLGQPHERELVQLAGDAADPTGADDRGRSCTYHLNRSAIAHPLVTYRHGTDEFLITCDVYVADGEPMVIHLICPRCRHALSIRADQKDIALELGAGPDLQGDLSVAPFMCTWERADAGTHVPGMVIGGGMSLCRWRVAIDHNVAKDA